MARRTVLYDQHRALGARMVDFSGWEMPVQYAGILAEHEQTRAAAGLFDTCHMGEVWVEGPGAAAFLDRVITRPLADMAIGECRYGAMCNEQGGIVDDCITYRLGDQQYMVVTNAGTRETDVAHLQRYLPDDGVTLDDRSDATGKIDIQGPAALRILQQVCSVDLNELGFFHFVEGQVAGVKALISRTGYTGDPGYELYLDADAAPRVWQALLDAGGDDLAPAGLGARDTLRLEAALPLYGQDMNTETNPFEVRMKWCVDADRPDLVGGDALRAVRDEGPARLLYGFRMEDRLPARHGYRVLADKHKEDELGVVTSGSFGPTVNAAVGLALLRAKSVKRGDRILIDVRGRTRSARIQKLPFYKNPDIRK
jgi:aminomethyltransferase